MRSLRSIVVDGKPGPAMRNLPQLVLSPDDKLRRFHVTPSPDTNIKTLLTNTK